MATITAKTFPGVYTQIIDRSFLPAQTSRFKPGLIGVASKGPFNTPTSVRSLQEFVRLFGNPVVSTSFFMADAVGILADLTDGIMVVRVGNQYQAMPVPSAEGTAGSSLIITSGTNAAYAEWMRTQGSDVYVAVSQPGRTSSVNLLVTGAVTAPGDVGTISTTGTLADSYDSSAVIQFSNYANAAWKAESALYGYGYMDVTTDIGKVTGNKGDYSFAIQQGSNTLNTQDIYAITDAVGNSSPTYEFRIQSVAGNVINTVPSNDTRSGYQAVPLQDVYTNGKLWRAVTKDKFLIMSAASAGVWANGLNASTGLYTKVLPGSKSGTKKIEVYWNSGIVETFDNLSANPTSADYYTTRINGISGYITLEYANSLYTGALTDAGTHAASTVSPWDVSFYGTQAVGGIYPMPFGPTNAGILYDTVSHTLPDQGGQFVNGQNGENPQNSDFVGQVNADDTVTGLKCFEDKDNVDVNIIAAPMDDLQMSVMQEMRRVAKKINALALADVPKGLNIWQAIDWHNGVGAYSGQGKIDDPNVAVFWNWFTLTSPFDGLQKIVPPSLGSLRCMAATWEREKPWFAAAGEIRGLVSEAIAVQFDRISEDAKQAMYGNGNSINPIWKTNGRFLLWGDRTMQRTESKLTAIHSVNLVNWIVNGLADLARQFVFDPNDAELLVHIKLAFTEFLDKIANERGLEQYELVVDERNNTAETRNLRAVIVDLAIVPVDVAERIYINATVRESGAQLNSVS